MFLAFFINAQQTTLFDSNGEAVAYVDYDMSSTIYLWEGTPVAFLEKLNNENCVIGFNGEFMGWYENGIIYDLDGYIVGAKEGAVNMRLQRELRKNRQLRVPRKPRIPGIKVGVIHY